MFNHKKNQIMKKNALLSIAAFLFTIAVMGSCTKEEVNPKGEGGMVAVRDKI